jgi:hypothetical protein
MKTKSPLLVADHEGHRFEILEDELAGFYLFRFTGDGRISTHDYLQDYLATAKEFALEEWGVPLEAWRQLASGERAQSELN